MARRMRGLMRIHRAHPSAKNSSDICHDHFANFGVHVHHRMELAARYDGCRYISNCGHRCRTRLIIDQCDFANDTSWAELRNCFLVDRLDFCGTVENEDEVGVPFVLTNDDISAAIGTNISKCRDAGYHISRKAPKDVVVSDR